MSDVECGGMDVDTTAVEAEIEVVMMVGVTVLVTSRFTLPSPSGGAVDDILWVKDSSCSVEDASVVSSEVVLSKLVVVDSSVAVVDVVGVVMGVYWSVTSRVVV